MIRIISTISIFASLLLLLAPVLGLAGDTVDVNISGNQATARDPVKFVANIYEIALMIGAFLAFAAIVFGGIKYTLAAGNPSGQTEGRDWITQAILGLLLLLSVYLILYIINPNLTVLKLPSLDDIKPGNNLVNLQGGGGGGYDTGSGTSQITHAEAVRQLQAAGVNIKPGANLNGIQQGVVDELVGLRGSCAGATRQGCDMTVTSAVGQHSPGTCSHANGYKVDLRLNSNLDNFIKSRFGDPAHPGQPIGIRSDDKAPLYKNPATGSLYAREANHWDMVINCR